MRKTNLSRDGGRGAQWGAYARGREIGLMNGTLHLLFSFTVAFAPSRFSSALGSQDETQAWGVVFHRKIKG